MPKLEGLRPQSKYEIRMKHRARQRLHYYIRKGHITPGVCQVCGNPKVEAHHDDYTRALEVIWLCKKHHTEVDHGEVPLKGTWLYEVTNPNDPEA
jgi:hypothetical protein